MEKSREEKVCAHAPCSCPAASDSDYCSLHCAKAFVETDCGCGHEECAADA